MDRVVRRYRRRKSSKVLDYDPWNDEAEPGDLMVMYNGTLLRLEQSTGRGKRSAGDLTPRTIRPPMPGLVARIKDGEVWWCKPNTAVSGGGVADVH